jgi:hypothetical protein
MMRCHEKYGSKQSSPYAVDDDGKSLQKIRIVRTHMSAKDDHGRSSHKLVQRDLRRFLYSQIVDIFPEPGNHSSFEMIAVERQQNYYDREWLNALE